MVRLDHHFIHPAYASNVNQSIYNLLQRPSTSCHSCSTNSTPPFGFIITILPDKIIFNREIAIYFIWLNKNQPSICWILLTCFKMRYSLKVSPQKSNRNALSRFEQLSIGFSETYQPGHPISFYIGILQNVRSSLNIRFERKFWVLYWINSLQFSWIESHNL